MIDPWPTSHGRTVRHRAGDGTPLVLVHGFSMCAETWLPVLPALTARHDVLVLALPGHLGGEPLAADEPIGVEATLDRLDAALDEAGVGTAHLVGNSLGGWLAAEWSRRGRARSLTLLSPAGGWELGSPEQTRITRRLGRAGRQLHQIGPRVGRLSRSAAFRRFALGDLVARGGRHTTPAECALLLTSALRCTTYDRVPAESGSEPPPEPYDDPPPTRFVWGEVDRLLPAPRYSRRWRRVLPSGEWVSLPGVGHVPTYDDPPALAAAVLAHTAAVDARPA